MKRVFIVALATAILSSCAGFTHVTVPSSSISYVGKDIETERYVEYTLTKSYVLGIGGMSAKARNTNIVQELMRKANLQTNETLAYISISKNANSFLGLITKVNFKASGYVVRPVGEYDSSQQEYKDVPYKGAFQGEDSIVSKYETTGGAKLVRQLRYKIGQCKTRDGLLTLRKEVEEREKNKQIDSRSADNIITMIDDKLAYMNN